ncbi:hypothetical protein ACTA71_010598 [Dictyostelium dimigraforme]
MKDSTESITSLSTIVLDKNYKKWDNKTVCKWLFNIKGIQKVSIEIFKANEIIGKDLEFLTDKILLKMGVGIRDILDFKYEYQILKSINHNYFNYNDNNNNFNSYDDLNLNYDLFEIVVNAPIINLNEYEFVEIISEGKFSIIEKFKKRDKTDEYIAIKKFKTSLLNEKRIKNEIDTLYLINHPNIFKIIGYCKDKEYYYIGMKYYSNNSIKSFSMKSAFSEKKARIISRKILGAINYLHSLSPPIIHGNIIGQNILLDENNEPILIDFGLSYKTMYGQELKTQYINPLFVSPEYYYKKTTRKVSKEADIFSFGSLISEMINGGSGIGKYFLEYSYDQPGSVETTNINISPFINLPMGISFDCKQLLTEITKNEPCFRPISKQLLNTPWFIEPPSSLKTNIITTDLLSNRFKEKGCYIIEDGKIIKSIPFCQVLKDSWMERKDENLPEPNEKQLKHFKKINNFLKESFTKPYQIKLDWYILNVNKEFRDQPFFRNKFFAQASNHLDLMYDENNYGLPHFFQAFQNSSIYQTIIQKPSYFTIVEYIP